MILALAAMIGIATASTSPAHFHAKPPSNGCDICFTAHIASLEAKTIAAAIQAPQVHDCILAAVAISGYRLFRGKAALTRGPPSLSLAQLLFVR